MKQFQTASANYHQLIQKLRTFLILSFFSFATSLIYAQVKQPNKGNKVTTTLQCPKIDAPSENKTKHKKELSPDKKRRKHYRPFRTTGCPSF